MPTYEYRCRKCGHRFDVFQRIVDPPVKNCPKCHARGSVEQLISGGSGLVFKGSGFYITDYKRGKGGGKDSGGSSPAAGDAAASDSKKPGSAE
jgi:putative FmdB family regulatory protein